MGKARRGAADHEAEGPVLDPGLPGQAEISVGQHGKRVIGPRGLNGPIMLLDFRCLNRSD